MNTELTKAEWREFERRAKFYGGCGADDVCARSDPNTCHKYVVRGGPQGGLHHHDIAELAKKYAAALHAEVSK